jgi:phosphatidylglycerophosphate synthase
VQTKWNDKVVLMAKALHTNSVSANMVTIFGFVVGMMAVNFLAMNMYFEALVCILINRFCDVLDGAIAKIEGATKFGVFLDLCLDYVFYVGVIFGFALADSYENAIAACFLLFGFSVWSTSLLAYGVVRHNENKRIDSLRGANPFYLGGAVHGFEMFCAFVLLCIMPFAFLPVAIALGCWSLIKSLVVVSTTYYKLVIVEQKK